MSHCSPKRFPIIYIYMKFNTAQNPCCHVLHCVRNEKLISMVNSKRYCNIVFVLFFSVGEGAFVIGLSQIPSYFSDIAMHDPTIYLI